ncbi:MAG TPA: HD domain-containing protein [Gemmataceae bacterium]|nr:HD domain-containing protein [Gemmataceae bacterium]
MSDLFPPALLEAIAFAARAHKPQIRKDNETPYVSHPFRVCLITRQLFGIDDPKVLMAAVLHDTVEDTDTDADDLIEKFGPEVANWVAQLSKDKRLPEAEREAAYMGRLREAPWQVKICKLADMYDNLNDIGYLKPEKRKTTFKRLRGYLDCLKTNLPEQARRPFEMVTELLARQEAAVK